MKPGFEQALDHFRGAWRFRRWTFAVAWGACILGWTIVFLLPDMYQSSARIYVDTRTALKPVLQGLTIEQDTEAQLNFVRQSLLGGPQLQRIARAAGLKFDASRPESEAKSIDALRSRITLDVQGGGERGGGAVYTISYQDRSRDQSLQVTRHLLSTLVDETLGGKRIDSAEAQRFVTDQIRDYERRLREAEQRLADFKKRNVGMVPGTQGDYFARLQNEMDAIKRGQAQLSVALMRRETLARQLRGEVPVISGSGAGQSSGVGGVDTTSRIKETQAKLDDMLLRYTDRHPDVLALRETLAQLKLRQQAELEALRRGDPGAASASGVTANPVYQSIQLALNQADVEIATIRGEISDHQRQVSGLRQLVDTVPQVEAEYARLNRDYDVNHSQYMALVDRLEKTKLGDEAQAIGSVRFEVIDPPTAKFEPVAPNRPRLVLLVFALALAAGGGLAYVLHTMRPVFTNTRTLNEITGLPVLGVVSMTWLEKHRSEERRGYIRYSMAAIVLVVLFVVVLRFNHVGAQMFQRVIG